MARRLQDWGRMTVYVVRYYDAKLSKLGRGVQAREFTDRAQAEAFAAKHRLYARPARVEEITR